MRHRRKRSPHGPSPILRFPAFPALLALLVAAGIARPPALAAQDEGALQLLPLLVTADKRETELQELPAAVSVFTSGMLEDSGADRMAEIARSVPNMVVSSWGFRGNSFVFVRGIGAVNNSPSVGFYVDGEDYLDSRLFDLDLLDIERVEVLRGPQGTLYGRNTMAGVVNIVTRRPDGGFRGKVEATAGDHGLREGKAAFSGTLVPDRLHFGLTGRAGMRDGYSYNEHLGRDVDDRRDFSGRAKLRWTPADDWELVLSADREELDDGVYPMAFRDDVLSRPFRVSLDHEGRDRREQTGVSLTARGATPIGDLFYIVGWRRYHDRVDNDQDFTPYPLLVALEDVDSRALTQEFRLSSPEGSGSLRWLAGLYHYRQRKGHLLDYGMGQLAVDMGLAPMPGTSSESYDLVEEGFAAFGQASWAPTDAWELTAGLRYGHDRSRMALRSDFVPDGFPAMALKRLSAKGSGGVLLPKIQVAYRPSEHVMAYVSAAKGYRAGGFNTSDLPAGYESFRREESWNYELGAKTSWLDGTLYANATLFLIDLRDQQVTQTDPAFTTTYLKNAGRSRSRGAELELNWRSPAGLGVDASLGLMRSEYREFRDPVAGADYGGRRTVLAPDWTASLAVQYRSPEIASFSLFGKPQGLRLFARAEWQAVGPFYWDDANTLREDAYGLLNLRLGLETESLDVVLWAENVLDEGYESVAFPFMGGAAAHPGDPRSVGITLKAKF
ncbi:MAG: TonB-dependent receptor [Deltaproteobacteria bacterium]|jgi:iron complex outermembrane receptor protein|nr:TonB-dependent receptor [Deltaproteobacteria bacterium]